MEYLQQFGNISAAALELAGVVIIVVAALAASVGAGRRLISGSTFADVYPLYRNQVARGILLGLEFLVAADIINTAVVELTFASVGVLAIIVLIRTFLSFTLELETTGRWPWQRS